MSAQNLEDEDEETTGPGGTPEEDGGDSAPPAATDAKPAPDDDNADLDKLAAAEAPEQASIAAKDQQIRDVIAKQYGDVSSDAAIQAAKAKAARTNQVSNIGEALEGLARSNSMAHGGAGVDQGFYQGLRAQGQQGVQQAQAQREQAIKDFVTKQQLGQQAVQGQQETAKFGQSQQLGKQEIAAGDPDSVASRVARASFKATFPKDAAAMGDDFNHLSMKNLGPISQMTDTKAKVDATKAAAAANREMAAARFGATQDKQNVERDTAFGGKFQALRDKYNKSASDLDKQDQLIEQAATGKGGIAGALVKGGALHEALGRVSQGELGMAQDPSLMNRAQSLLMKIDSGATLTPTDIAEYKAINGANRAANDASFLKSAQEMTDTNDRAARHPAGYSAALVGLKDPAKGTGPQTADAGGHQAAPHGQTVVQGGVTFTWNGSKYVPTSTVGVK